MLILVWRALYPLSHLPCFFPPFTAWTVLHWTGYTRFPPSDQHNIFHIWHWKIQVLWTFIFLRWKWTTLDNLPTTAGIQCTVSQRESNLFIFSAYTKLTGSTGGKRTEPFVIIIIVILKVNNQNQTTLIPCKQGGIQKDEVWRSRTGQELSQHWICIHAFTKVLLPFCLLWLLNF